MDPECALVCQWIERTIYELDSTVGEEYRKRSEIIESALREDPQSVISGIVSILSMGIKSESSCYVCKQSLSTYQ